MNGRISRMVAELPLAEDERFNDGVAGPGGRYWAGTVNGQQRPENALYCLNPNGTVQTMDYNLEGSNGIGWSPDRRTMYFVDSPRRVIYAYDFDTDAGTIANRRAFVHTPDEPGVPDGIAVDAEGCVWCAYWDGWRVVRYDPSGKALLTVPMPCARPTAPAFGGADLSQLYVASARIGFTEDELIKQPNAGSLFVIQTDTQGGETFTVSAQ
jgi:sugar lactone lactonase YvrE